MSNPRVVYTPRPDATTEGEISVLANVYSFVLRCGEARRAEERKNAVGMTSTGGDDMKERSENDLRASSNCT